MYTYDLPRLCTCDSPRLCTYDFVVDAIRIQASCAMGHSNVLVVDMTRGTCMFKLHLQVNSDAFDTEHLEQESFIHLGMHEVS